MGPIVPEICEESGGYKKIKWFLCFFNLVGPILLLSAEKRTERSTVYGLSRNGGFSQRVTICRNELYAIHNSPRKLVSNFLLSYAVLYCNNERVCV